MDDKGHDVTIDEKYIYETATSVDSLSFRHPSMSLPSSCSFSHRHLSLQLFELLTSSIGIASNIPQYLMLADGFLELKWSDIRWVAFQLVGIRAEFDQRRRETVSHVVSALVDHISNIQYPKSSFPSPFSSISYHATTPDTDRHKSILSARESLLSCNIHPFIHASIYAILKDVRCSSKASGCHLQVAGSRCVERIFVSFVPDGCGFNFFSSLLVQSLSYWVFLIFRVGEIDIETETEVDGVNMPTRSYECSKSQYIRRGTITAEFHTYSFARIHLRE